MDQETNMWFHGVLPGPNNFGTKSPRVHETGSSYGVNTGPAPMGQQVPIDQYFMSVAPECLDSPNVADQAKLKRKAYEVARDPERKKEIDKAYRRRCKEKKMKTEETLVVLTEENNKVKRENSQLKKEEVRLQGIVKAQNETMKQLQQEFGQLKSQLDSQHTVVEVLSKQHAQSKTVDVQRQNEQLKREKALLIKQISNPNTMKVIQLQAKIVQLESEVSSRQLVIDALCKKMKTNNY